MRNEHENIALEDVEAKVLELARGMRDDGIRKAAAADVTPSHAPYSGMLSCFFQGFARSLLRSSRSARATRRRVECGMITSST